MRFSLAVAALSSVVAVSAVTIPVSVGFNNQLVFNPANISAQVGDVVAFTFLNKNHSVTQSTFATPCHRQTTPAEGISSGFQPVAANATELPEFSFTVNNASTPLWFYCGQTNPESHCNHGMVFSVNADPDSLKSFAAYQALAATDINTDESGSAAASAAGSAVGAATSAIGSAVGGAVGDATSAVGGAVGAATSAAAGAAGAAATGAASILGGAAGALTSLAGGAAPSASAGTNHTNAAFPRAVGGSTVSLFAVAGLAAILL